MKIKKIKINNFGNLENKEINLNNNINIIYGKNESGKSTLLKFIFCMLYGISKNKNGREISDYERYKPWGQESFSGKMEYELDNGRGYEVFRDFNKKTPEIYDENLNDITKTFSIDKNTGNNFFKEQVNIEEEIFKHTVVIEQNETKLEKQEQNILIQKIANLVSSGDDNISFKKSIEKLNKKLVEEIGTDRTSGRPINIVEEKLGILKNDKQILKKYKNEKNEIKNLEEKLNQEISYKKILLELIKRIKKNKEQEKIEQEIIKINKNSLDEINNKIKLLEDNSEKNISKKNNKKTISIFSILIILNLLLIIFNKYNLINYFILSATFVFIIIYTYITKNKKKNDNIEKEIKLLEENRENRNNEIKEMEHKLKTNIQNTNENILLEFNNKINISHINNYLNQSLEKINISLEEEENNFKEMNFKLHKLELDKKSVFSKLDEEARTDEEIENLEVQMQDMTSLSNSINIAKTALEEAYSEMKSSITPKFTQKLSKIADKISNSRYKNIKLNDNNELTIETSDGKYINANFLSIGAIDQIYLSLRLSIANELINENLPIILDESFVYYDDERLENIFKYLYEEYKNNQILILTCSEREIKKLNELNINYNLISL